MTRVDQHRGQRAGFGVRVVREHPCGGTDVELRVFAAGIRVGDGDGRDVAAAASQCHDDRHRGDVALRHAVVDDIRERVIAREAEIRQIEEAAVGVQQ